jgi:hypothetical protein
MATIAKTAGSFDKVLASCKTIGAQYQPNVPELSLTALSQLHDRAQQSLRAVTDARIAYRMAVNNRKDSFAGIPNLAVRIVRMMAVCSRDEKLHLEDAVLIKDKLYPPKKNQEPGVKNQKPDTQSQKSGDQTQSGGVPARATRASGRLSFDQQMETFSNLVALAEKMSNYTPVEPDVSLEGLKQKLAQLHSRMQEVAEAQAAFKKARLERDQVLYGKDGVKAMTKAVKNYIHGAFGISSDEFEQLKGS